MNFGTIASCVTIFVALLAAGAWVYVQDEEIRESKNHRENHPMPVPGKVFKLTREYADNLHSGAQKTVIVMGEHTACFLTQVNEGPHAKSACYVTQEDDGNWQLEIRSALCAARCIDVR